MIATEVMTPRLTHHARQRCQEMGLTTKRAKRVVQNADVVYPGRPTACGELTSVALWDEDPEIAVVFVPDDERGARILTVLWNGDFSRDNPPGECP